MQQIEVHNPGLRKVLLFGTDLPSTRARIPFSDKDLHLVTDNFSVDEPENIFYKNALEWYDNKKTSRKTGY